MACIMDFRSAWEFVRATKMKDHDPLCSYVRCHGSLLCDCHIIWDEYKKRSEALPTRKSGE